jgi:hemerythrin-like domain-containing protein
VELHLHNPVEDATLTRSLADVMGHLRSRQYGIVAGHLDAALQGSGDAFIDTLARHLLYEEEVLFPELRRLHPSAAGDLLTLQAEHGRLRELATELARAIKSAEMGWAYDVARTFLAELYRHIDHEAKVTDEAAR